MEVKDGGSMPWLAHAYIKRETLTGLARSLAPLSPSSSLDELMRCVDYVSWAMLGGKCAGDPTLVLRHFPKPLIVARAIHLSGTDAHEAVKRTEYLDSELPHEVQGAIRQYLADVLRAYDSLGEKPLVSQAVLRRSVREQIHAVAVGEGISDALLRGFRPAIDALVFLFQRTIVLNFARAPILAIYLPFVPEETGALIARHPEWLEGTRALNGIYRMLSRMMPTANRRPDGPRLIDRVLHWTDEAKSSAEREPLIIPFLPPIAAIVEAILHGGPDVGNRENGWQIGVGGAQEYAAKGHGTESVIVRVIDDSQINPSLESDWGIVKRLNLLTAEIALVVLSELFAASAEEGKATHLDTSSEGASRRIVINSDAIPSYRTVGASAPGWSSLVREHLRHLACLRFDWIIPRDGGPSAPSVGSSLIHIGLGSAHEIGSPLPSLGSDDSFDIKAGEWLEGWLADSVQWAAQPAPSVSVIPVELLQLDHRDSRGAAALAKRLGFVLHLDAKPKQGKTVLRYRIEGLLDALGELPALGERSRNWAGRTRDRFENAMLILMECGIVDAVTWPALYGPGESDRYRGWPTRWLAETIVVTLPDNLEDLGGGAHRRLKAIPNKAHRVAESGHTFVGQSVAKLRRERGMTQKSLALQLGLSASYLSQIENGERQPSSEVLALLNAWMGR